MNLDRVTITGADNSTDPQWMARISQKFPWVEWGILLSSSQEGTARFPSASWMEKLKMIPGLQLCGHLCGKWVREICIGRRTFEAERPSIARMFQRAQLNFHSSLHKYDLDAMANALKGWDVRQYILQFDQVNDSFLVGLAERGVPVVPLFDTSGGAGVEPTAWPVPVGEYSGYAGGLHPDRIETQIQRISGAAGPARIWVDVETHVRSADDQRLVPERVVTFLEHIEPHVSVGG